MTFTIGAPEIAMTVGLFALVTTLGTVVGNYFVLKSQVASLRIVLEHLVDAVSSQDKRLVAIETTCTLRHGKEVQAHV